MWRTGFIVPMATTAFITLNITDIERILFMVGLVYFYIFYLYLVDFGLSSLSQYHLAEGKGSDLFSVRIC